MPQCYVCGDDIARGRGYRRRVNTGESTGVTSRGSFSFRSYYGDRTLCQSCAKQYDRSARLKNFIGFVGAVAFLIVVGLYIYDKSKSRPIDDAPSVARKPFKTEEESPATQAAPAEAVQLLSPVDPAPKPNANEPNAREEKRLADQLADLRARLSAAEAALSAAQRQASLEQERSLSRLQADPVYRSLQKAARDAEAKVIDARARGGAVATASQEWVAAVGTFNTYAKEHSAAPNLTEVARQQQEVTRLRELVSAAELEQVRFNAR